MPKPTKVPRFAEDDMVDSGTGLNNVAEPPEGTKDSGWVPAFVEPSRRYMNWLHRYYYLWCKWANEEGASFLHGTESAKVIDSYFGSEENFQVSWTKIADVVTLNFPEVLATGAGGANGDRIIINPVTTWNSAILPITALTTLKANFQSENAGIILGSRIGQINIPTGGGSTWLIERPDDIGDLGDTNFVADASVRGWRHQCISYITEDPLT